MYRNSAMLQPLCSMCCTQLSEPYIECAECEYINMCTVCFSKGAEIFQHRSDHSYAVRKNNFPLFDNCNWTAKDEYYLLKNISEHGYGNWEEISKSMQTHTKLECQEHYKRFYFDDVQYDELLEISKSDDCNTEMSHHPFLYRESNSDDPPRQTNCHTSQQLAGYNPFRSEFELNFDNNAENVLSLEMVDNSENDKLTEHLQCSLVTAYNNKLRERKRRYNIIRHHGLIVLRKFNKWLKVYSDTLTQETCERLCVFMQLVPPMEFDIFMESLSMERELQTYLHQLYNFRRNGLKTFKGCRLYRALKTREENNSKQFKIYLSSTNLDWKNVTNSSSDRKSSVNPDNSVFDTFGRDFALRANQLKRNSNPLEITGMPGYEQLSEKERTLCSSIRLVPTNFLMFKNLLIAENNKNGCLRLLDARKLIKIDVNKTRKIYDYLITEGFITKPI